MGRSVSHSHLIVMNTWVRCVAIMFVCFDFVAAESFCGKGPVYKGIRRHAKKRVGRVEYMHSHYFVKLEEGGPPKDYYNKIVTPDQQLDKWLDKMHKRKISNTL